ncbi:NlpC/P60 family protein [Hyphomonas sp. FCG-A18]|uniref:NlpC/P60 family protein n=1 Tax=Hyphomonas sp. FCG-A18 TaxID=3080019 RepID=UPI002B2CE3E9|nr:NlpC/P60 family protein [Hyphomonas sp. FCG-A18]
MREDIVKAARGWIGTPYRHQASRKGVGTDCLGLLRGVWREVIGPEPEHPPPYSPDWAEALGQETLLETAQRHMVEIAPGQAVAGDVLLFRMGLGMPAKHCAIVSGPGRIIHAYWGRSVCETRLVPWWQRRIAAAFAFPETAAHRADTAA